MNGDVTFLGIIPDTLQIRRVVFSKASIGSRINAGNVLRGFRRYETGDSAATVCGHAISMSVGSTEKETRAPVWMP